MAMVDVMSGMVMVMVMGNNLRLDRIDLHVSCG